jgi:hypothetical protein
LDVLGKIVPQYTYEDLKEISGDQLSAEHYPRAIEAFNGLMEMFEKEWVEKEAVVQFLSDDIIQALGKDRIYGGISHVEKLVFLWEDIQITKNQKGFDNFSKKLKHGVRCENVDLEISVAADLIRCNASIELEPEIGEGKRKADCKFRISENDPWVYVEITRKMSATTQELIDKRGRELAKLVSLIKPQRRCILVLRKEVNEDQYLRIIAWLKTSPLESEFEDVALFFTVAHGEDDSQIALKYVPLPVSIRQDSGDMFCGAFGVVYLHIPDYGAEKKLKEKIPKQLPKNEQGILVVDLSIVAGGFVDWESQIKLEGSTEHCGAVLLLQDGIHSTGLRREIKIIQNYNSINQLSASTIQFLDKFSKIRKNMNLMADQ